MSDLVALELCRLEKRQWPRLPHSVVLRACAQCFHNNHARGRTLTHFCLESLRWRDGSLSAVTFPRFQSFWAMVNSRYIVLVHSRAIFEHSSIATKNCLGWKSGDPVKELYVRSTTAYSCTRFVIQCFEYGIFWAFLSAFSCNLANKLTWGCLPFLPHSEITSYYYNTEYLLGQLVDYVVLECSM